MARDRSETGVRVFTTSPACDEPIRQMLADLHFLIDALDHRVPHLERMGEARIARDAADLRARAIEFIHRIEGAAPLE